MPHDLQTRLRCVSPCADRLKPHLVRNGTSLRPVEDGRIRIEQKIHSEFCSFEAVVHERSESGLCLRLSLQPPVGQINASMNTQLIAPGVRKALWYNASASA